MIWEYKIESLIHNSDEKELDKFKKSMNMLGKEGWELVTSHLEQTSLSKQLTLIFKRSVK